MEYRHDAVLTEGRRVLISDPRRFAGVKVIGVDEHVWRHTPRGDKYVHPHHRSQPGPRPDGTGRLLDMVEGRSKQAFKTWSSERDETWRTAVEVVCDGWLHRVKSAAVEELDGDVTVVMDPSGPKAATWRDCAKKPTDGCSATATAPAQRERDCHFESICEACTFFVTTIEFRPTLQRQRDAGIDTKGQRARQQIFQGLIDRLNPATS